MLLVATIGRGLVPSRAYDGSEYHMPIFVPSAEVLGGVRDSKIGELVSPSCDW